MNRKISACFTASIIIFAPQVLAIEKSAGGVINFNGAITDTTCTINGGKSSDFTVTLNPITVTDAGTDIGIINKNKKTISLTFSDCSPATEKENTPLTIYFSSANNISTDGYYLKNMTVNENDSSISRNVGFAISKAGTATALPLNKPFITDIKGDSTSPNTETLNLDIHYYKTNALAAKVGSLSSNVVYTISYL